MNMIAWIGSIVGLSILDYWCHRNNKTTLSSTARYLYRTNTKVGKSAFAISWFSLSVWLIPHIWNGGKKVVEVLDNELADMVDLSNG